MSTALKTDITKAADQALTTEEIVPARCIKGRRASMPASMLRRKCSMSRKVAGPSSVLSAPAGPSTSGHLSAQTQSDVVRFNKFYFMFIFFNYFEKINAIYRYF